MFNYLKLQAVALFENNAKSPFITFICLVTIFGYFLSFFEKAVNILSVTPGFLLPPQFWIWTAFTFCFIEFHFWEVLVDIITVGLCGKLLEPLWGQMEMFTFFAITNLGVAILTSFYYLFVFMCTRSTEILFNVHIHGLAGYVAAVSVAVRQMMPDHLIAKTRMGKFTNRNVPLTVLFASLVLWIVGLLDGTYPAMFCSGLIVSWVYLRFYQRHPNGGRGDSTLNFTFAGFFPNVMQPVIIILVNPVYLCCLKLGIIKPPVTLRLASAPYNLSSVSITMAGVDPHDIERRRQIALKALSERLKTADTTKHNLLPKSFPQHQHNQHHNHHHHHHHGPVSNSSRQFSSSMHSPKHNSGTYPGDNNVFHSSGSDVQHNAHHTTALPQQLTQSMIQPPGSGTIKFDPSKALENFYFPPAIPLPPPPSSLNTADTKPQNPTDILINLETEADDKK